MELGWLSPTGEMIEADYMQHYSTAMDLCDRYYSLHDNPEADDILMERGWVHITMTTLIEHGYMILWHNHLTASQKHYLKPLVEADWDWINRSCQYDLKKELKLDYLTVKKGEWE